MARTVADAFNQYHQNYVKPQVESKLNTSAAAATYATQASLALKADLNSPNLTGTPTAPTVQDLDDNSTKLATTEFVADYIRRLLSADLATIETIYQLSVALNQDKNFSEAVVQALSEKLTQSQADGRYIQIGGHAGSATRDANGNVITETYATKTELSNVSVAQATSSTAGVMKLYNTWSTDAESTDGTWTGKLLSREFNNVAYLNSYNQAFDQSVEFKKGLEITGDATNNKLLFSNANWSGSGGISKTINALRIYNGNGDGFTVDINLNKENNRCEITASGGLYVNGTKLA